jgi:NADH-ubiquinone oxidoreductase chain 5
LPKAIAAPTPVSSLVHSSTLVTAGRYLLFRYITLWEYRTLIYSVSLVTVLVGRLLALTRFDLKEIIAFSTLSQIGFLVFILAAKIKKIMFFHLITHAMFKAELFICSGFFIYYSQGLQDIRLIYTKSNIVKFSFFFSLLAMSGVPFLSGFYSKDLAIEQIIYERTNVLINLRFVRTALLTSLYSSRLIFYLNLTKKKVSLNNIKDDYIRLSINFLVVFSLFLGRIYM